MPVQSDFSFEVPGDPEEVAARIKSRTRWRPIPDQGSFLGGGEKPLGGVVNRKGFRIALDKRDWFNLYQAVARGTLTQTATGTRVEGQAGLHPWITWILRFAFVGGGGLTIFGAISALTDAAGAPGLVWAPLLIGATILFLGMVTGMNVRNADEQVPRLLDEVREAAGGLRVAQAETQPVGQDDREAEAKLRAAQQARKEPS